MHRIAAAILLFAFIGQTFQQAFYYIDYVIDRAAYEKKCINKTRPQMECHGKCQLMKYLEEQEKKDAPVLKLAARTEVLSSKTFFSISLLNSTLINSSSFRLVNTGSPVDQPTSLFHPPDC